MPNATSRHANPADAAHIVDAIVARHAEASAVDSPWPLVGHDALALAEHERQLEQLRAANQQAALAVKRAEALQAAAQEALLRQTDFLAVLAHELRGPLAAIRSAADALGALSLDAAQLSRVHVIIARQTEQASRLIEDLLDISRARSGKLRLVFGAIDLRELIEAAAESCRPAMARRGQRFNLDLAERGELRLRGDAIRLAQVLDNLLQNASKYTPEHGQVGLQARLDADSIVLTVSDSGIGMRPEALPAIFDSFAQEAGAVHFNGSGLGIGLAVVRELVLAHGGSVTACSAGVGQGSRFVVRLPLSQ